MATDLVVRRGDLRTCRVGPRRHAARLDADFATFEVDAHRRVANVRASGPEAVGRYWLSALEGRLSPAACLILRL